MIFRLLLGGFVVWAVATTCVRKGYPFTTGILFSVACIAVSYPIRYLLMFAAILVLGPLGAAIAWILGPLLTIAIPIGIAQLIPRSRTSIEDNRLLNPAEVFCTKCGRRNVSTTIICPRCGTRATTP